MPTVDKNKEKKNQKPVETTRTFGKTDDMFLPMLTSLFYGMPKGDKEPSRKHCFQQMLFAIMKPCESLEEAKEMLSDMQEALDSTKTVVDSMVW